MIRRHHLHKAYIGSVWENRVAFKTRAYFADRQRIKIGHEKIRMGIAHGTGRWVRYGSVSKRHMQRIGFPRERHIPPAESCRSHINLPHPARHRLTRQIAGNGAHHHLRIAGFGSNQGSNTARGIAASAGFRSIRVVDAHKHIGARHRRLHDDQLVAANAAPAIRKRHYLSARQAKRRGAAI